MSSVMTAAMIEPPALVLGPDSHSGCDAVGTGSCGLDAMLCDAAVGYVQSGWPVLPLRGPDYEQFVCHRGPSDEIAARLWWSDRPYGIGCRTGERFDVVQVPAWLGRPLLAALETPVGPVLEVERLAVWQFFVTSGSPAIRDFPRECRVRLLAAGDWVALPPTPRHGGRTRWVVAPTGRDGWRRLPNSLQVQWAVVRAWNSQHNGMVARSVLDESARDELCRRYQQGATIRRLAAGIGRSRKFVRRLLLDAGIPLRHEYATGWIADR